MKKLLLSIMVAVFALGVNAQSAKGDAALVGNVGYQTDYKRFGIGVQGRYAIMDKVRVAPDVTFFFPKDKVTGLDVNVNLHYVFNLNKVGESFSVYPLAGIGMQNNLYGKQTVHVNGEDVKVSRDDKTKFAVNLGAGISFPINAKSFLNAEAKFMFADKDNVVILLGYGYKF